MAASLLAADTSSTVALVVAVIALVGTVITATFTWLSTQRERETKFQAERRELYAALLTTLRTGKTASDLEGPIQYTLLLERVLQVSPEIRAYIDDTADDEAAVVGKVKLDTLREAMDYQQKPWASRRARRMLRRWGLARSHEWLQS